MSPFQSLHSEIELQPGGLPELHVEFKANMGNLCHKQEITKGLAPSIHKALISINAPIQRGLGVRRRRRKNGFSRVRKSPDKQVPYINVIISIYNSDRHSCVSSSQFSLHHRAQHLGEANVGSLIVLTPTRLGAELWESTEVPLQGWESAV